MVPELVRLAAPPLSLTMALMVPELTPVAWPPAAATIVNVPSTPEPIVPVLITVALEPVAPWAALSDRLPPMVPEFVAVTL